jgi:hypothetical protein
MEKFSMNLSTIVTNRITASKQKLLKKLLTILSFSKLSNEHLENSNDLECKRF